MRTVPPRPKRITERTRTAYHEAGHAVLSAAINDTPELVSIREEHATLGRTRQRMFARPTLLVQVHLAGFAAEHLHTGRRSRQLDQEVGFAIVARLFVIIILLLRQRERCATPATTYRLVARTPPRPRPSGGSASGVARVVEDTRLISGRTLIGTEGSNPSPSASRSK